MDESTLIEMSLLADNRDALCEELCKFAVEIKLMILFISFTLTCNFIFYIFLSLLGARK